MEKFKGIKEGCKLLHYTNKKVIEVTVNKIDSNKDGIYIYAEDSKGRKYRFILIAYSIGKTHFNKDVFTNEKDLINKYEEAKDKVKYNKIQEKRKELYKKKGKR